MAFPRRPLWLVGALLVTVASALVAPPASAATFAFSPAADAYVGSPTPNDNFGTAATLRARDGRLTSYLRFDVAGIPAGETVSSATLHPVRATPQWRPSGPACTTRSLARASC